MIHEILKRLLFLFIRILYTTYRFETTGLDQKEKAKKMTATGSHLIAIWHEQVFGGLLNYAYHDPYLILASRSKDGDFAAYVSLKLGFIPVRGSSKRDGKDKGGKEAIQIYIDNLKKGLSGGVTIDGPKGPRQVCKPGIIIMAKEAGCPIVPMSVFYSNCFEFKKAWDKFKIPLPFSKIYIHHNEPLLVTEEINSESLEHYAKIIKDRMDQGYQIISKS